MEEIIANLSGTVSPWLMGTFFALGLAASFAAIKSWREMKRSPYFFQRLQAGKHLQTYSSASLVLFVVTMVVGFYSWQEPADTLVRSAILSYNKPVPEIEEEVEEPEAAATVVDESIDTNDEFSFESAVGASDEGPDSAAPFITVADQAFVSQRPTLPEEYDRFDAQVELNDASNLGTLDFSTEVTDDYEAVDPRGLFSEGFYTLYATFDYDGLGDGMVWSWIWRLNGEVVEGGNEVWAYGEEGPGYIFFSPEEGFQAGQYSLDIWVNGELMAQSSVVMNDAAVAANN
ncbi:MAG: hypothetical protein ACK2U6_20635 [Candidatus Promineifilaceae bacterium]